jgi:Vinculin family.
MPSALVRVEGASRLLEEASAMLKADPYSGPARYVFYLKQMDRKIKYFLLQGSADILDILS